MVKMLVREQKQLPILESHQREYEQIREVFNRTMVNVLQVDEDRLRELQSHAESGPVQGQVLGGELGGGSVEESEGGDRRHDAEGEQHSVVTPLIVLASEGQAKKLTTLVDQKLEIEKQLRG